MNRRTALVGLLALGLAGCSVGGPSAYPFTDNALPLGKRMQSAVKAKDLKRAEKALEDAGRRLEGDKLTQSEYNVLEATVNYAKEGNWEAAKQLIDESVESS